MSSASVRCPSCDLPLVVDGALGSAACPHCSVWLHAVSCPTCDEPFVAVGSGRQVCPHCSARLRIDEVGSRSFGDVRGALDDAMSRVEVAPPLRGAFVAARGAPPGSAVATEYAGPRLVSLAFKVLAVLAAVAGVLGTVVGASHLASTHGGAVEVASELLGGALATAFGVAGCAAVFYGLDLLVDVHRALTGPSAVRGGRAERALDQE